MRDALQRARDVLQARADKLTVHSHPQDIPEYNKIMDAIEAIDEALNG